MAVTPAEMSELEATVAELKWMTFFYLENTSTIYCLAD